MFDKNFYPTPIKVLEQMGFDPKGMHVLEPSAGKGDIVKYLLKNGAKNVYSCELHDDLRTILASLDCEILGKDCMQLTAEQVSHINLIVMNPPFDKAADHLSRMYEIAPEGCEIHCLMNIETVHNNYSYGRKQVKHLIESYGGYTDLGECFSTAERKTNVSVAHVTLYKPMVYNYDTAFDGFYLDHEHEGNSSIEGVMGYDEITATVQRYVHSIKAFYDINQSVKSLNDLGKPLGMRGLSISCYGKDRINSVDDYLNALQKAAWSNIFDKMNMSKFLTSGVMKDINKFIKTQRNIPFTKKNIYRMLEVIVSTIGQQQDRAVVEAIDNFTKHYKENQMKVEGWATNSAHMLNKKFIAPNVCKLSWSKEYLEENYQSRHADYVADLTKIMCYLTGEDYNSMNNIREFFYDHNTKKNELEPVWRSVWYDLNPFFEIKLFIKGTAHIRFKTEDHWALINKRYAEIKGLALPQDTFKSKK